MATITYGELGLALARLGFTSWDNVEKKARVYEHAASGAEVYLPIYPDDLAVYPWHMITVRFTLDQFGLSDPFAFCESGGIDPKTVTYGELGRRLQRFGFGSRDNVERKARIYEHADSGAEVILPLYPADLIVQPRHLAGVRFTLDQFGLPDLFAPEVDSSNFA